MMSWTEKASARAAQLGLSRAILLMLAALLIYGVLNVFLNFFNSWALSSKGAAFSFPLFYSLWHMVASALGCWLLILIKKRPLPSWSEARRTALPHALPRRHRHRHRHRATTHRRSPARSSSAAGGGRCRSPSAPPPTSR